MLEVNIVSLCYAPVMHKCQSPVYIWSVSLCVLFLVVKLTWIYL